MSNGNAKSDFTKKIDDKIQKLKKQESWRQNEYPFSQQIVLATGLSIEEVKQLQTEKNLKEVRYVRF